MSRRKRVQHEEHVNHERWLVSYADFITLLFVLFVVMFSMSRADVAKFAKLKASLQRAFSVEVLQGDIPTSLQGLDGAHSSTSVVEEALMQHGRAADVPLISTLEELRQVMSQIPMTQQARSSVQMGFARDGLVISLSGNVLFDSGKSDLKPAGLTLLDTLGDRLVRMPNELRIEGHTDNIPIATPLYPSNWELSSARATTVARYLAERGLSPARLIAAGYGEHRPVVPNDTREGRARNRRVDIVILSGSAASARAPLQDDGNQGAAP